MDTPVLDLGLLDVNDGRNPFEEIMSQLENLSLQGNPVYEKDEMEKNLLFLERKYQDYHEQDKEKSNWIAEVIKANVLILQLGQYNISMVNENLKSIKEFMDKSEFAPDLKLSKFSISHFILDHKQRLSTFSEKDFLEAYQSVYHFIDKTNVQNEDWTIELNFQTEANNKHLPLEFIYTFIEGLNTIEGVDVRLEDIKIGSIKARINVAFTTPQAKEEFKSVLSKMQSNPVEEATELLTESIEETENAPLSLDALHRRSLELDVERKKLENDSLRFKNFVDRRNVLAELLREGIITQRNFEMLIKGLPFLHWEDGRMTIGESIDVIDNM